MHVRSVTLRLGSSGPRGRYVGGNPELTELANNLLRRRSPKHLRTPLHSRGMDVVNAHNVRVVETFLELDLGQIVRIKGNKLAKRSIQGRTNKMPTEQHCC